MNLLGKKRASGHSTIARSLTVQVATGLFLVAQGLLLASTASAETLARAQGRCKLTSQSGTQTFTVFDGHCIIKQKQQGSTTLFVVDLDNGSEFRFFGPNKQALQVETSEGIHNAQFTEGADKGVFAWQEDGDRNRLSVKLDAQQNPNVSHDDTSPTASSTPVAAAVGTLLTALLTGKAPASTPTPAPASRMSQTSQRTVECTLGGRPQRCTFVAYGSSEGASVEMTFPDGFTRRLFYNNQTVVAPANSGDVVNTVMNSRNFVVDVNSNEVFTIPRAYLTNQGASPSNQPVFGSSAPITPARQTNFALVAKPVDDLSDLVGARAGQAENTIKQRGYQFVRADEAGFDGRRFSFWRQPNSGLCVTVITQDGRYNTIVYSNVSNQTTCK